MCSVLRTEYGVQDFQIRPRLGRPEGTSASSFQNSHKLAQSQGRQGKAYGRAGQCPLCLL